MRVLGGLTSLLVCAACGGDDPTFIDAANVDASAVDAAPDVDAALLDAAATPVTLAVSDGLGAPAVGATVLFLDPTDALIAEVTTDAVGRASAVMPSGGSVIYLREPESPAGGGIDLGDVYAFTGVQPGASLYYGPPVASVPQSVQITVPIDAGTTRYDVLTPCGLTQSASNVTTIPVCGATTDVLVTIQPNQYAFLAEDVVVAPIMTVNGTYQAPASIAITLQNPPGDLSSVSTYLSQRTDTIPTGTTQLFMFPGQSGTISTPVIAGAVVFGSRHESYNARNGQIVYTVRPRATTLMYDMQATPVPEPSNLAYAPGDAQATWSVTGAGTVAHAVFDVDLRRGGNTSISWVVSDVGGASPVRVPVLPAPHDNLNPLASDARLFTSVTVYAVDTAASGASLAARPFDVGGLLNGYGSTAEVRAATFSLGGL